MVGSGRKAPVCAHLIGEHTLGLYVSVCPSYTVCPTGAPPGFDLTTFRLGPDPFELVP